MVNEWCISARSSSYGRRHAPSSRATSDAKFGFEQIVHRLRVCLAAGRLHHLPDKPADELRLGFRLLDLVGIGGDDVVDNLFDGSEIGDLLHTAGFDQRAGIATLVPDDLEQVFGYFSRDGA